MKYLASTPESTKKYVGKKKWTEYLEQLFAVCHLRGDGGMFKKKKIEMRE